MTKPMTKTELIAKLAEGTGSDRRTVQVVLDELAETIVNEVGKGGAVTIPGIVKIACRDRPARQVRNPATGAIIDKAADRKAVATVLKAVKDAVSS